ncbi:HAD-IA family hydrolase, partial [Bacillus thuringiensis]|nr:HAD-IA family hydrolase [Bacillus thuringiensis]
NSKYHHFKLFDFIASSWNMKACKPEVEYFNRIMLSNNVKSSEMLLIDDNPEVIKAASQLGIDTIF